MAAKFENDRMTIGLTYHTHPVPNQPQLCLTIIAEALKISDLHLLY